LVIWMARSRRWGFQEVTVWHRLLLDRVRKLDLEDSGRLEISGVCEDFYG
jgi:hypothetical protein